MKFKFLDITSRGPALWIALNRPEARNALHIAAAQELLEAVRWGLKDKKHPVLVLTGRNGLFSAGGDIREMSRTKAAKKFFLDISKLVHTAVLEMRKGGKPVIASIPGYAGGVAFGALLGADLRIASSDAVFQAATINIGLVANGGATYFLPRLTGLAKASEILLTGDPISAEEALQIGLINRVVPLSDLQAATQEYAEKLASRPRKALLRARALLNLSLNATLPAQLERERQAIAWSSTTQDFREGIDAFLKKRRPSFNQP